MTLLTDPTHGLLPGVHALVVGAGKYPHLVGGDGVPFEDRGELGQLSSPAYSAKAFAEWLKHDMELSGSPLRSMRVLASPSLTFSDYNGNNVTVEEPTLEAINLAVQSWFEAANRHPENLSILYFCGHGISIGDVNLLLAQDFGVNSANPFDSTFDPDALASGMLRCRAQRQLYLIDACRMTRNDFATKYGVNVRPRPLVVGAINNALGVTQRAMLQATRLGSAAYGTIGGPSLFMKSFIKAVNGAGASQNDFAQWIIEPSMLRNGINHIIKQIRRSTEQFVSSGLGDAADFPLHELPELPVVPVLVSCKPLHHLESTVLSCSSGDVRKEPADEPWMLDLPLGNYVFEALSGGSVFKSDTHENRPPRLVVTIPIEESA